MASILRSRRKLRASERGIVRSVRGGALALVVAGCSPAVGPPSPVEPTLEVPRIDGGSVAPASGGVRFGRVPAVVGTRWKVLVTAKSASADPQGGMQLSEYVSAYDVEVLATDGPAPSRVRVAFERNVQRYQGADKPTAIDGKTYDIDARTSHDSSGRWTVRDGSGAAASEEEAERVRDVFPDLGTRTQVDQILPDTGMAIGDARNELAGAILRVIHPRAWTLNEGTAVLARTDGDDAVFAVVIDGTGSNGLRIVVKGEARVRLRDARLVQLVLDGTYDHATGSASDPGTFSLRRTVSDF